MNPNPKFYEKLKDLLDEELKARLQGEEDREIVFSARLNLTMDVDQYIHAGDEFQRRGENIFSKIYFLKTDQFS